MRLSILGAYLIVLSVYRPSGGDFGIFTSQLHNSLNYAFSLKCSGVFLCGDFNVDCLTNSKEKNFSLIL